jgi:hypothetical protein
MSYFEILFRGIEQLIAQYQDNPFDFLYESDIQGYLFSVLFRDYKKEPPIEMLGMHWPANCYGKSPLIATVPVKCEYPTDTRFDIALIDPRKIKEYTKEQAEKNGWKSDLFWNQPVRVAIEIKYAQLGFTKELARSKVKKDIAKLRNYLDERTSGDFLGLSLLFIQSFQMDLNLDDTSDYMELYDQLPAETGIYAYVVTQKAVRKYKIAQPNMRLKLTP